MSPNRPPARHLAESTRFEHPHWVERALCGAGPLVHLTHDLNQVTCKNCHRQVERLAALAGVWHPAYRDTPA